MNELMPNPLLHEVAFAEDTSGGARVLPDLIARRAYELFELRGRAPGRALEDWLKAEREVRLHFTDAFRVARRRHSY